jgi:hypothetical protein
VKNPFFIAMKCLFMLGYCHFSSLKPLSVYDEKMALAQHIHWVYSYLVDSNEVAAP